MSDIGVMGLGKLGLIMALVLNVHGKHNVTGYDVSRLPADILSGKADPPREADIHHLISANEINMVMSAESLVANSDVIFVAVQTPHPPQYDGTHPGQDVRDFEYGYLVNAVRQLSQAATDQCKFITIAVISTVLPGTCDRLLRPLLTPESTLVYTPSLIALGTVSADLLDPEFVIVGSDSYDEALDVVGIYATLHNRPVASLSIPSAELTKVAYNTYTSMKIVFANTMLEIADKTGADVDSVTNTLVQATRNLMGPGYMTGGLAGGGYCHPRDVNAMSHLARKLDLSSDLFGFLAQAREAQSGWLASLVEDYHGLTGLPVTILGNAYKPESDLTGGSPGALLFNQLMRKRISSVYIADPYTGDDEIDFVALVRSPRLYVIGCGHRMFSGLKFGPGSVVIDPVGIIPDQSGVTVVRLGRKL